MIPGVFSIDLLTAVEYSNILVPQSPNLIIQAPIGKEEICRILLLRAGLGIDFVLGCNGGSHPDLCRGIFLVLHVPLQGWYCKLKHDPLLRPASTYASAVGLWIYHSMTTNTIPRVGSWPLQCLLSAKIK